MKRIKLYEEFDEMKTPSLIQRAIKGTKRFFGVENSLDRQALEKINRIIDNYDDGEFTVNLINSVKEIKPGVIVSNLMTGSLVVDTIDNTIMYKGKELELNDLEYECKSLYYRLKPFM